LAFRRSTSLREKHNMAIPTYKIVLLGNTGSGKTSFVRYLLTGEVVSRHVPTLGVEVHPLVFRTSIGQIRLNMWDTAGDERFGGLCDGYYIKADGAYIFSSADEMRDAAEEYRKWNCDVKRVVASAPVIACHTKSDLRGESCLGTLAMSMRSPNMRTMLLAPILKMLRQVTCNPTLHFVNGPAPENVPIPA
jgi:GTP-binding nuclear protein Ran